MIFFWSDKGWPNSSTKKKQETLDNNLCTYPLLYVILFQNVHLAIIVPHMEVLLDVPVVDNVRCLAL
jgi:hypothetical protein